MPTEIAKPAYLFMSFAMQQHVKYVSIQYRNKIDFLLFVAQFFVLPILVETHSANDRYYVYVQLYLIFIGPLMMFRLVSIFPINFLLISQLDMT